MSSIYAGKKLSKVRGEKVIGDKRSNNIREDLIIRFHVTQGREKAKFFWLSGGCFLKQRKQVQKPKCGSMSGHVPGITRKSVWLEQIDQEREELQMGYMDGECHWGT